MHLMLVHTLFDMYTVERMLCMQSNFDLHAISFN